MKRPEVAGGSHGLQMLVELGSVIRTKRLRRGISEQALCDLVQISVAELRAIEQGLVDPDTFVLVLIAQSLGCLSATLLAEASRIENTAPWRQRVVALSARARMQLDRLERQNDSMLEQISIIQRQLESTCLSDLPIGDTKPMRNSARTKLASLHSKSDKLQVQRARIDFIRTAYEESSLFLIRSQRNSRRAALEMRHHIRCVGTDQNESTGSLHPLHR